MGDTPRPDGAESPSPSDDTAKLELPSLPGFGRRKRRNRPSADPAPAPDGPASAPADSAPARTEPATTSPELTSTSPEPAAPVAEPAPADPEPTETVTPPQESEPETPAARQEPIAPGEEPTPRLRRLTRRRPLAAAPPAATAPAPVAPPPAPTRTTRADHTPVADTAVADTVVDTPVDDTPVDDTSVAGPPVDPEPAESLQEDDHPTDGAADEEPAPRRRARPTLPSLPGWAAAALTGLVVGVVGGLLTYASLRGCEAVRGAETCGGGPGLLLLLVILVLMVLLGGVLLRLWDLTEPRSTSFLAVGVLCVVLMVTALQQLLNGWMFLVVPVLAAVAYALAHVVTSTYVDPGPERGPEVDVR